MRKASQRPNANPDSSFGPRAFVVRLTDDAMSPELPSGTMVVCDPDARLAPGAVVIAATHGGGVCRRYDVEGDGRKLLRAVRHSVPPLSVGPNVIVGRVVRRIVLAFGQA